MRPTSPRRGEDALWMARARPYDAIVLDVMLPGLDGFSRLPRAARGRGLDTGPVPDRAGRPGPTASTGSTSAATTISSSRSRSRSCSRGCAPSRGAARSSDRRFSRSGPLRLDPAARRVWRGETELELSAKEFALLELFMRRAGQALSRVELLEGAWDMAYEQRSNVVDVYVRYLREKIDRPFGRDSLRDGSRRRLPPAG